MNAKDYILKNYKIKNNDPKNIKIVKSIKDFGTINIVKNTLYRNDNSRLLSFKSYELIKVSNGFIIPSYVSGNYIEHNEVFLAASNIEKYYTPYVSKMNNLLSVVTRGVFIKVYNLKTNNTDIIIDWHVDDLELTRLV